MMRSMSNTLARLAKMRASPLNAPMGTRLTKLDTFGPNPGALLGWFHCPRDLPDAPPLVVVLHGCTQTAAGYDLGSGWSKLADDYGFVVLFPEQLQANNANRCFNWFNPEDIRREGGEVHSIRQMIAALVASKGIDQRRIFVTGLSAGGAMANAMLASYPEVFAGGAIIAGLPYGIASTVPEAFDRMRGHGLPPVAGLQQRLSATSSHNGKWPTISVWHGSNDTTVMPANAKAIIDQWRGVHGLSATPTATIEVEGASRAVWRDAHGTDVIEFYSIAGMSHGTPIDPLSGYGMTAPFMLDVGISSTEQIARSWGLMASFERREVRPSDDVDMRTAELDDVFSAPSAPGDIQGIIEKALRSAGLMR